MNVYFPNESDTKNDVLEKKKNLLTFKKPNSLKKNLSHQLSYLIISKHKNYNHFRLSIVLRLESVRRYISWNLPFLSNYEVNALAKNRGVPFILGRVFRVIQKYVNAEDACRVPRVVNRCCIADPSVCPPPRKNIDVDTCYEARCSAACP